MMEPSHRWASVLLIALVAVVSAIYLTTGLCAARGRFVAPLDDAYITFQYARQIARGHPYRYNDGDPPTTGMTSPLFGFLLAGVYRIGFTNEHLVTFALGLGVVWLGLVGWLTYCLAFRLVGEEKASRNLALFAATLVLLTGPVQWGCFNGMETGLFTIFTLAALHAFLVRQISLCALWLGLAGLARPEGLILAGLTWVASLIDGFFRSRCVNWKRQAVLSVAVGMGFAPSMVNWALTGKTASTGLLAKAWWFNIPYYPRDIARSILNSYREIIYRFLGWKSSGYRFVPPGLFPLSFLGWIWLGVRQRWSTLFLTLCWFLIGTLSTAALITADWHLGRYQLPFVPTLVALSTAGLYLLYHQAKKRWQCTSLISIALLFIILSIQSLPSFIHSYHNAVETMVQQHLQIIDWMRTDIPRDLRIGITDAGALRYLGNNPTYDLIGLTTPDAATAWRHGSGSVFELMEQSPIRPSYFALFPDISIIPYLAATDLFAEELYKVEVSTVGISSPSRVKGVWRADWHLAGSGERFYQPDIMTSTAGLELVDALDVADLRTESSHSVEWWQDARRPGFPTEMQQLPYRVLPEREVLDGGRLLTGGMTFDVNTKPGKPLWIVARLHAREAGAVRVEADGQGIGRWAYPPVPGQWLETVFRIPSEKIAHARTQIVLRVDAENPDFRHYAPYYFWFLQGEPEQRPVSIEHRVHATFAENLSLLGFDLPHKSWRPGDVVPVTLYWQVAASSESNAKAFLHLYDTEGNLGPQADGWAYYGTRPPYTWRSGEVVVDPRQIPLSGDLPRGTYSLEVGLYDPDSLERLPAYRDGIHQPEGRVPLATIEVKE